MNAPSAIVKGHQMIVVAFASDLTTRQMICSCGYAGMVRASESIAAGDLDRHAFTVRRDA
jgi:hypothetical protein